MITRALGLAIHDGNLTVRALALAICGDIMI